MSKFFRALFISAVATGVAAIVLNKMRRPTPSASDLPQDDTQQVDADRLTDEQRDLLVQEMEAQHVL